MKTRSSEIQPEEVKELFLKFKMDIEEPDFASRVKYFRKQNKQN
jgi:hypothetical protein